jgi:hypothetical protein
MDQLERAARDGLRVAVVRRGNEYVVVARRIEISGSREVLVGVLPITGEEKRFELDRIEAFQVIP